MAKRSDFFGKKDEGFAACVYTRAVLAIFGKLPVGNLRVVRVWASVLQHIRAFPPI
ncbi:MAG: hypothetical protein K2N15_00850 [Lachnospiraceae bacterium]|nr:hypothetical protein [Lachnospiraceae bacterium]